MPGPATDLGIRATLIEQHSPPEILVHGLVKPEDVEKLFQIFYERVNPFISLLDPVLHTPASTFARCPFLFTVVCAIASRYYAEKSEIYPIAMHFAKHSAANALIDGWKSVELCQAYILMSIYAVPARRWEEDRSWLYTGLAIRIATDLNLHQVTMTKTTSEKQEREILNKTRVWMICFNLDRSTATQFGKPSTIKEDFITKGAKDWYKKSQYNHCYDIHLCAYSALLQIVAKFHDEIFSDSSSPTGLNKKVDFRAITLAHDANLTKYHDEWSQRFKADSDSNDPACVFRCSLLPFLVGYSRLVMFSFGFQQAYQRGFEAGDRIFFTTCLDAAKAVIENMIDGLAPSGYMRFAPDGHFIFASFASAFLLKLLKPEFSSFLVKEQENEIFDLIGRLIQTLSSPKISIDDRHTPKLYARFLAGLLSRHRRDGATVGRLQTMPPPSNQVSGSAPQASTSSVSSFSLSRPSGSGMQSGEPSFSQGSGGGGMNQTMDTPIYMPEATFAAGTGAIHFAADFDMAYEGNSFSDEEMLATMQAIKNPAWWSNMMMPGFSWPEGSPSPPANQMPSPYPSNMAPVASMPGLPGLHPSLASGQDLDIFKDDQPALTNNEATTSSSVINPNHRQIYVMEASCPHLGVDMSHAEIEECESSVVAVCPWHRYDFDLKTGKSETGLRACTYSVEVRTDPEDGLEKVFMETPEGGSNWRLVELRPVSEEFADPPPSAPVHILPQVATQVEPQQQEPVVPTTGAPKTLMEWAVLILNTPNPTLKVERTRHAVQLFRTAKLTSIGNKAKNAPRPPDVPPREASFARNMVDPNKVKSRKNRAVMLHALANIEQWAIDLAWDIIARFGPKHPDIPPAFFVDFTKMALDESKHFDLTIDPIRQYACSRLSMGISHRHRTLIPRAACHIHLVHEARGLDVNPATIERFRRAGDHDTVKVMEIIHADEVTHVTSGHRWFTWICAQANEGKGVDPVEAFREEVKRGWRGEVKGPFNVADREKAGLTPRFYEDLRGEMGLESKEVSERGDEETRSHLLVESIGTLSIGYDKQ
ncbi:hypothetical protein NLJ89_g5151 [Agrocybe chaxingu]|uniref:Rieske domain-containing protein n=1 Tax=Agrocybe chaxingu TaxID=84603 RepID=A0A9W8K160_9AGAR|nr:hypothetical protein NLJ89_g5151 [Agrocybe chaxingu]